MRIRIRDQQSKNLLAETGGTSRRGLDYLVSRSTTRFVQYRPIYHDA